MSGIDHVSCASFTADRLGRELYPEGFFISGWQLS